MPGTARSRRVPRPVPPHPATDRGDRRLRRPAFLETYRSHAAAWLQVFAKLFIFRSVDASVVDARSPAATLTGPREGAGHPLSSLPGDGELHRRTRGPLRGPGPLKQRGEGSPCSCSTWYRKALALAGATSTGKVVGSGATLRHTGRPRSGATTPLSNNLKNSLCLDLGRQCSSACRLLRLGPGDFRPARSPGFHASVESRSARCGLTSSQSSRVVGPPEAATVRGSPGAGRNRVGMLPRG